MSDWKVPVSMVDQAKEITRLQAENEALRLANRDAVAWESACKADLDKAMAENEALRARVAELEGSIKQAIGWIDGDLRDIIRDVGNHICSYNDLYESADRIEHLLAGVLITQAAALERQSEGGE